jgi:hypothetical protein
VLHPLSVKAIPRCFGEGAGAVLGARAAVVIQGVVWGRETGEAVEPAQQPDRWLHTVRTKTTTGEMWSILRNACRIVRILSAGPPAATGSARGCGAS